MSRQNYNWLMTVTSLSLLAWFVARSSLLPPHGPLQFLRGFPGADESLAPQLAVLSHAFRLIEDNYVHELQHDDRQRLLEHTLESVLQSLDEHSSYISPENFRRFRELEQGHFGGIGVQVGTHPLTNQIIVQSPIPNTPAFRANLHSGDIILEVNGQTVTSVEEAVNYIKGPPGTKVRLTVRPWGESELRFLDLERADIPIESVLGLERLPNGEWNYWLDREAGLAYVRLEAFNPTTSGELYSILSRFQKDKLRGLILDLRGNPGGRLETAIEVAELFLPKDSPIVTVRGRRRAEETYRAGHLRDSYWRQIGIESGHFQDLPLVVLIDGQSASASEILASALQDNRRATLLGQRTFGKASVQTVIPLPPNHHHAIKLTTAEYLRPSGQNIHRFRAAKETDSWGVHPDIAVPRTPEQQQQTLLSRRFRDIFWQKSRLLQMEERFHASSALLGSTACVIDPDNTLYIRASSALKDTDPVLETAHPTLLEKLSRR